VESLPEGYITRDTLSTPVFSPPNFLNIPKTTLVLGLFASHLFVSKHDD
jgi:hypothetical protein